MLHDITSGKDNIVFKRKKRKTGKNDNLVVLHLNIHSVMERHKLHRVDHT